MDAYPGSESAVAGHREVMLTAEAIYARLPVVLQNAACTFKGWRYERSRFRPPFDALLAAAEERSYWSVERISEYRDRRLRAFVEHCARTVPFYRERFRSLGVDPQDVHKLEDLAHLPVTTKEDVRDHGAEFRSDTVTQDAVVMRHTSGTTGTTLSLAMTHRALQEQEAIAWRFRRWHGLDRGTWCAYVGGAHVVVPAAQASPPYWRYNLASRQLYVSTHHFAPFQLDAVLDQLRRRRPPWFHGLPSALALLADRVVETGRNLGYEPRWITVAGENLLANQAEVIERAFARPIQRYVMTEAAAHASECEQGSLHLDEDLAATELVPEPASGGYRVVGTSFTNLATPLLRYEVGDLVMPAEEPCSCGRPGRVIARVDGRLDDYGVRRDGSRVGNMDLTLKGVRHVREAQLHQVRPGELTYRLVVAPGFGEADRQALVREVHKRVGPDTDVTVECVDRLPRQGGKLRFMINEIPVGQVERVGEATLGLDADLSAAASEARAAAPNAERRPAE